MRYLLAFLLIFISFSVNAQNRFPSVDSAKNYVLRFVKNSAVETFTNWRAQNVAYGTLELLDSLASDPAVDSIWKTNDTLKYSKGGVNYTIGTVGVNLNFTNGLTQSGSDVKLGGNLTENTTINAQSKSLTINNSNITFRDTLGNITAEFIRDGSILGISRIFGRSADGNKRAAIRAGGGIFGQCNLQSEDIGAGKISIFDVLSDSITLTPNAGRMSITSMETTSDTITHKPMVYDVSTKRWKYKTDWGATDTATVVKAYVTNAESVTITKGQVVYIFGASGDRAAVKLAKNTSDTFSSKTLGIVRADIAAGQAGWVTTQGQVSGINLGAYTAGDILWLDSVPGGFTKTKPVAPYHSVFIGVVERANAGNGLIYVKPQNGQELGELHDVKITSPTNNQVLAYTAATDIWENKTIENILQFDTIPLAAFGAGSGAASDTAAFTTSAVYGSFYNAGNDTLIITQMRAGVLGTSPNITTEVYWNDSLNVTAGATILVTGGTSVTGTIGATNVTSFTNNKIPPNNWVFVRTSAVATKPTYFTLTLLGYRKRQ